MPSIACREVPPAGSVGNTTLSNRADAEERSRAGNLLGLTMPLVLLPTCEIDTGGWDNARPLALLRLAAQCKERNAL